MDAREEIILIAEAHVGKRYRWGGLRWYEVKAHIEPGDTFLRVEPNVGYLIDGQPMDYFCDLNCAFALADFMAERGWNCEIANGLDKTWECEFLKPATAETKADVRGTRHGEKGEFEIHYGAADKLEHAICEAFLRALGKWEEE